MKNHISTTWIGADPYSEVQNGCYYHRDYSDTLWKVHDDMTLQALLVENKIKKVPLEQRTEYSGKPMSDYITTTLAEKLNVVRYYETSLYYIAEYKAGGHSRGFPTICSMTKRQLNYIK